MNFKVIIPYILMNTIVSYAQQIGNGYAAHLQDFNTPLLSGFYGGPNAVGKSPDNSHEWQHLLVIRHANPENNYELQLGSSYSENDRLFFRKIDNTINPVWHELATRGTNSFTGNQIINGSIGVGKTPENAIALDVKGKIFARSLFYVNDVMGGDGGDLRIGPNTAGASSTIFMIGGVDAFEVMRVSYNGNVGIGKKDPTNKLDVNGTIHSKEVKVDMSGWSDFVFKKEYNLPTLEQVGKHIAEKGYLENIPSEEEVLKNGINLGEMNAKLLQKIEELTLYVIEQNNKIDVLEKQNEKITALEKRLNKIESNSK